MTTIDPGLRRLALGTLLAAFRGPVAPEWARDLTAEGLAGFTLFGYNVETPEQLAALTASLREIRPSVLLAIDEEGGDVTRLAHATGSPYPGNAALGAAGDVEATRAIYRAIGLDLAALGINVNLAPTVDVNSADDNPVIGTRSFGADPALVSAHTAAAVAGLQEARVAACAKHFPGHGDTVADSHTELPTVDVPLEVLRSRELPPFEAAIGAGARTVMTAHIRVPVLTGDDPATFSPAVLRDLLRDEFGFTGAVITDALEMKGAAVAAGGIAPAAVRALSAGADLLCIGADVDADLVEEIVTEIIAAVGDGRLSPDRLADAASRNAALAAWTAQPVAAGPVDPSLPDTVARRAVRIDGTVSGLDLSAPLMVQLGSASNIAEGRVPWGLGGYLPHADLLHAAASEVTAEALAARAGERPIILVGRHLHRFPASRALAESLAASHPTVIVELGWPSSSWRPAGACAFIRTHGATQPLAKAAAALLKP
ncbi:glycoside hydrolase family 3 protein [Catenuloplanes atrovinosus]|uniref:Beta-N-acetylhexosaminidase n=1 Tax=Catenuloplanes atrovinosus TaxID=137266 RepID=A0AAE3YZP9_9ACTN|nr:glycoside hydrolase family 3 N-terminal domain-containing protein [Catenuloplanes atrovinosus]MDR7281139.1 beta-N-acetylhexosaminidase [Catenuloplanes atrovinosus]